MDNEKRHNPELYHESNDPYLDDLRRLKAMTAREEVELEAAAGVPEAIAELNFDDD